MPIMLNKETIEQRDLNDQKWFSERIRDLVYSPGMTQEALEKNLITLRSLYKEKSKDGMFLQYFSQIATLIRKDSDYQSTGLVLRMPYTQEDFLYTEAPYQEVAEQDTVFKRDLVATQLDKIARSFGIKNFKQLAKRYDNGMEQQVVEDRQLVFPLSKNGEKVYLQPGNWQIDSTGIHRSNGMNDEYACSHPIAPIMRLVNIDNGSEKRVVAFERGGTIKYITVEKQVISDVKSIIALSGQNVDVTSVNVKPLVAFLQDVENANYDIIPEQQSVGRLGWMKDGRFSPYVEELVFDGDVAYGQIFHAIRPKGKFELWRECAVQCRQESITAQIMLAASFASVLIEKLGGLCFFVHLWGVDSGTGKSVGLMLAASVWGDPEIGQYPQTFNATQVGHEKTAVFLNSIPMCIDELQLSKDSRGQSKFNVYQLAEGSGRTRGNKQGGIDSPTKWRLCILTTGESPIVQSNAGAGAVNRVIDIECKPEEAVIRDGAGVCKIIRTNFGTAGRKFIEGLTEQRLADAQTLYDMYFRQLSSGETTEKQAMAAAMILTADALADVLVFHTGKRLSVEEISEFLKSKSSVSAGERGYRYLCDWVALNSAKFAGEGNGETYGIIDGDYAYINRSVFRSACKDAGFDERALLSWMKKNGIILTRGRNMTRGKRIAGVNVECVAMRMPDFGIAVDADAEELL